MLSAADQQLFSQVERGTPLRGAEWDRIIDSSEKVTDGFMKASQAA